MELSDLEKAFDLVAPIIASYGLSFKVVDSTTQDKDISEWEKRRFTLGSQITVYLEDTGESSIPEIQLNKMIEDIDMIFHDNNIAPGLRSDSDARMSSVYFSIRNDKFYVPAVFSSSEMREYRSAGAGQYGDLTQNFYISALESGTNYNPSYLPNPYLSLIGGPVGSFNFANHFKAFNAKDKEVGNKALIYSCLAYLRVHTHFDLLSQEEMIQFEEQCISYGEPIESRFLKEEYRDHEDLKPAIKLSMLIVLYGHLTFNEIADVLSVLNGDIYFSGQYEGGRDFLSVLQSIEEDIRRLPKADYYTKSQPECFVEFIEDRRWAMVKERLASALEGKSYEEKTDYFLQHISSKNSYLKHSIINQWGCMLGESLDLDSIELTKVFLELLQPYSADPLVSFFIDNHRMEIDTSYGVKLSCLLDRLSSPLFSRPGTLFLNGLLDVIEKALSFDEENHTRIAEIIQRMKKEPFLIESSMIEELKALVKVEEKSDLSANPFSLFASQSVPLGANKSGDDFLGSSPSNTK